MHLLQKLRLWDMIAEHKATLHMVNKNKPRQYNEFLDLYKWMHDIVAHTVLEYFFVLLLV